MTATRLLQKRYAIGKPWTPRKLPNLELWWDPTQDYPSGPPAYVFDTFTRGNGPLGNAESGQAWTFPSSGGSSAWAISAGAATPVGTGSQQITVLDTGSVNTNIFMNLTFASTDDFGIVFRMTDDNNYWMVTRQDLYKRVAGVFTSVMGLTAAFVSGDGIDIVLNGSLVTIFRNGVSQGNYTMDSNLTATKVGLRHNYNGTAMTTKFDNIFIQPVPVMADYSGKGRTPTFNFWIPPNIELGPSTGRVGLKYGQVRKLLYSISPLLPVNMPKTVLLVMEGTTVYNTSLYSLVVNTGSWSVASSMILTAGYAVVTKDAQNGTNDTQWQQAPGGTWMVDSGVPHSIVHQCDGTHAGHTLYQDGSVVTHYANNYAQDPGVVDAGVAAFLLGVLDGTGALPYLNNHIYEVAICSSMLTPAIRASWGRYVQNKYGFVMADAA